MQLQAAVGLSWLDREPSYSSPALRCAFSVKIRMLYGDRPISSPRQDVLGRSGFALELAKAIDNLNLSADGFVMGLLGDWGTGKSSVVELIVRYLRHIEMSRASKVA